MTPPDKLKLLREVAAMNGLNPDTVDISVESTGQNIRKTDYATVPKPPAGMIRNTDHHLAKFITIDPGMILMKERVRKLANLQYPVLILGETGTGKEIVARALHSTRTGNFVEVNCGGFPEHLVDSELFGHVRGSFTGAEKDKVGLFQAANNGTLFLDEIGELPMFMQSKLLRALQEKVVRRVGAVNGEWVNCRVVAATNQDLEELVEEKRFRSDLLYRLNTFEIRLTPLRVRTEDARLIAESMNFDTTLLPAFEWTGNVRELQNWIINKQVFG